MIDGILYLTNPGCPWAFLPSSFGRWKTVYGYFRGWTRQGGWPRILDRLTRQDRRRHGRKPTPSAGGVDSQTIKSLPLRRQGATHGKTTGYDAGKKIKGRKRHLLVDSSGWILQVRVTAADVDDRAGLKKVLSGYFALGVQRLRKLWVDGGYSGIALKAWVAC